MLILKDRVWLFLVLAPMVWTTITVVLFGSDTVAALSSYAAGMCASVAAVSMALPFISGHANSEKHASK